MTFNINKFRAQVASRGLAKSNLFYVTITVPEMLRSSLITSISAEELSFFSKTVQLPSMELNTTEYRQQGYGKAYKRPMDFSHASLPVVFMVDAQFGVMKFFHRWMQGIYNYNNSASVQEDPQGKLAYEFEYHDNYIAVIDVYVYSMNNSEKSYHYKFYNAYPTNISEVSLSWENDAEVMTLPVNFEYDYMSVESLESGPSSNELGRQNGLLTYISAINGYGQAINQISRPLSIQDAINTYTNINTIYNTL